MAAVGEDVFALRRERIDALGKRARALNESILELQEQVRRDLPDAEPRGVRVVFDADGVLESVEIDDSLSLTEAEVGLVVGIVGLVISLGLLVLSGCDLGLSTMQAKDPVLDAFKATIPPWPAVLS